jgi:hypothetical protein
LTVGRRGQHDERVPSAVHRTGGSQAPGEERLAKAFLDAGKTMPLARAGSARLRAESPRARADDTPWAVSFRTGRVPPCR